jgi:hypothetical protein
MADVSVNTEAVAYKNRHNQFRAVVGFWIPVIQEYFTKTEDVREEWRQNDPFLRDLLRFVREVEEESKEMTQP